MTGFGCTETAPFALSTGAGGRVRRHGRLAGARPRAEAGAGRRQARSARARPEHHARLLARRGADAQRLRRGRLLPARRRDALRRSGRSGARAWSSTAGWPRTSSCRPAPGSASGRCGRGFSPPPAGYAQDVVITGHDREFVGALIFPNLAACRELAGARRRRAAARRAGAPARRAAAFSDALDRLARESTGSSTFVARALLLDEPPSLDAREITDKGSINQKAVLQHRAALVDELYAPTPSPRVMRASLIAH